MPYQAQITRTNPTALLFVIDQSGSMSDNLPGSNPPKSKAQYVADLVNRQIQNFVISCARDEGVRDYFYIGAIGYGAAVDSAFGQELLDNWLQPISKIATNPKRTEERQVRSDDGAGGLVTTIKKFQIWIDPVANGGTPMCEAFGMASRIIEDWLASHPNCFPPVVVHVTDGESTDGNPDGAMQHLRSLASTDGNVLLCNIHASSNPQATSTLFPATLSSFGDEYARTLFSNSSNLTSFMVKEANTKYQLSVSCENKLYALNCRAEDLSIAVDIGTKAANPSTLR